MGYKSTIALPALDTFDKSPDDSMSVCCFTYWNDFENQFELSLFWACLYEKKYRRDGSGRIGVFVWIYASILLFLHPITECA